MSPTAALLAFLLLFLAVQLAFTDSALQAPTQVTLLKVVRNGRPTLRVNWTAPQSDVNISEYHVQYRRNGSISWGSQVDVPVSTLPTATILPALDPGIKYNVRVGAVSADKKDVEWSEVQTEKTFNTPSRVTGLSVTELARNGTLTLNMSWSTPQSDLTISQYQVEYKRSGTNLIMWINATALSDSPPAQSTLLTGLDAGTEYNVRVRAVSVIGAGEWSVEKTVRTADSPTTASLDTTSVGAAIAAVLGVILLVLLVVCIMVLVVWLMRKQGKKKRQVIGGDDCERFNAYKTISTTMEYCESPRKLPKTRRRTSPDIPLGATKSSHEYDDTIGTTQQTAVVQCHYEMDEGEYWEPDGTLDGIRTQMHQKTRHLFELQPESITVIEELGEGAFGMVHKGEWASSPQGPLQVAVKSLHCQEEKSRHQLLEEGAIMGQFSHPNVVRLYGVIDLPDKVMLIMEYLSGGDLLNLLTKCSTCPECKELPLQLLRFCQEIADAMEYLSKKSFIHRDLAARNILLDEEYTAKIADFGMSHDMDEDYYYKAKGGKIPLCWTAPEAVFLRKYTTKSDVWSYGMVMYEIWSLGHKPFEEFSMDQVTRALETRYCQPPPPGCPRNIYKLMVDCWDPKHHSRPTFEDLSRELARDPKELLSWSEQDKAVSSKAAVLGAPLQEGRRLYQELQEKYNCSAV